VFMNQGAEGGTGCVAALEETGQPHSHPCYRSRCRTRLLSTLTPSVSFNPTHCFHPYVYLSTLSIAFNPIYCFQSYLLLLNPPAALNSTDCFHPYLLAFNTIYHFQPYRMLATLSTACNPICCFQRHLLTTLFGPDPVHFWWTSRLCSVAALSLWGWHCFKHSDRSNTQLIPLYFSRSD
jgi:hypothetical protein